METPDSAYYNVVDQIYHADWTILKMRRQELVRRSIATMWPDGHPAHFVHLAGTSGKGSVARLMEAGFSTVARSGAYVNPHVFDYRERFTVDGVTVARDDVTAAWEEEVRPYCVGLAMDANEVHTFAEVSLLLALVLFDRAEVATAMIETGLGGRYAQSMALDVAATVVTNVGDDHPRGLGTETWQRALEKAGIARAGVPMFTAERSPETLSHISAVCRRAGAPLVGITEADVAAVGDTVRNLDLAPGALLRSEIQLWNAALALAVIRHLAGGEDGAFLERMAGTEFLGRLTEAEPGVFIDVAHNPDKVAALAVDIERRFPDKRLIFVVGASAERPAGALLGPLVPLAKAIIVTSSPYRGRPTDEVTEELTAAYPNAPVLAVPDPQDAIDQAREMRDEADVVIVTGSTFVVDSTLNPDPHLRHLNGIMGWRFERPVPEPGKPLNSP